ncbi:type II toxin-antitoxin system VapC family toxin [Adlercreutzia sp. ZJ473]|uniref:type II toxin-antitoxin system VapC family toxin n=1 Tax=Adlercreutzia sp. ZJ473 TaxID=2722822 RepID=UPI001557184A
MSDISAWEIAIRSAARPGSIPFTSREFAEACEESGLRSLPVSLAAIVAYEELGCEAVGSAHRDPLDRLLIAQSKVSDMLFLTHDEILGLYGEPHVVVV